jgi:hypothetical protein
VKATSQGAVVREVVPVVQTARAEAIRAVVLPKGSQRIEAHGWRGLKVDTVVVSFPRCDGQIRDEQGKARRDEHHSYAHEKITTKLMRFRLNAAACAAPGGAWVEN